MDTVGLALLKLLTAKIGVSSRKYKYIYMYV
jgi:hypothetical protein